MPSSPDPAPAEWARLDAALDRAFDLDGAERDAFIATLADDLRSAVERALADDPLLDAPEAAHAALAEDAGSGTVDEGTRVGPYVLEALVGEGGMGRVYRARRADGAYDRTVAVKVVRQSLALAGSDVAARLRRERDLLAALDHPHIARLVDGGETEDGVPYLVTDFVIGEPITTYAESRAMDVRERVRLVMETARAVDHAHRRFVVHRDLKPSNVLVTEADGVPHPVVLDFGIAKLAEAADDATDGFPLTRTGMRLLSPAYAAPELFDPTLGVTTAADVYGLGAILYELLTGTRPHGDAATAPTREPTRPSKAVASPVASANPTAARALRGDLDTICLKALHPDPARRYASAAALADDLERHLSGRPVEARPDSAWYVAGRFARRNRALVGTASGALLALLVTLGFLANALADEREVRAEAESAAARATEASNLLAGLFYAADPQQTGRQDVTAREALTVGIQRVASVESQELRGYLYSVLGRTYATLSDLQTADSLLALAVSTLDSANAPPTLRAEAYYDRGRNEGVMGRYESGRRHLLRAVRLMGPRPADPVLAFNVTRDLSWLHRETGHLTEAIEWANRAMERAEASGSTREREMALWEVGASYSAARRYPEAIGAVREAYEIARAEAGPDAPGTLLVRGLLATVLTDAGEHEDALRTCRDVLPRYLQIYGPRHERLEFIYRCVGLNALSLGLYTEARRHLDSAAVINREVIGPDAPSPYVVDVRLAEAHNGLRAYSEAERHALQGLRSAETHGAPEYSARARHQLGRALAAQGRRAEAREAFRRALSGFASLDPPDEEQAAEVRAALAALGAES